MMHQEAMIQSEVDAVREQFSDTKALYREVCALLFFRHGITPTASKLYQYVRKGSMSAPAEALAKFWEELRDKARVEIDHPNLPDALKQAAGQAVHVVWTQATDLAREEWAVLRGEAQTQIHSAQSALQAIEQQNAALHAQVQAVQDENGALQSRLQALVAQLEQERRSHAATAARSEALAQQVEELTHAQAQSRAYFSAELEKGRAAVDEAIERATQTEHRALQEIDRERMARTQADKRLEQLRLALAQEQQQHHAQLLEMNITQSRLQAELGAAQAVAVQKDSAYQAQAVELQQALEALAQHKQRPQPRKRPAPKAVVIRRKL